MGVRRESIEKSGGRTLLTVRVQSTTFATDYSPTLLFISISLPPRSMPDPCRRVNLPQITFKFGSPVEPSRPFAPILHYRYLVLRAYIYSSTELWLMKIPEPNIVPQAVP